jgi:hypothetical protein
MIHRNAELPLERHKRALVRTRTFREINLRGIGVTHPGVADVVGDLLDGVVALLSLIEKAVAFFVMAIALTAILFLMFYLARAVFGLIAVAVLTLGAIVREVFTFSTFRPFADAIFRPSKPPHVGITNAAASQNVSDYAVTADGIEIRSHRPVQDAGYSIAQKPFGSPDNAVAARDDQPLVTGVGPIVGRPVFGQTLMLSPDAFLIHGYYVHTSPRGGAHDHMTGLSQYAMLMIRDGSRWRVENVPAVAWKSSWPCDASGWDRFRSVNDKTRALTAVNNSALNESELPVPARA